MADAEPALPDGAVLVRVLELSGFGSREAGQALAIGAGGDVLAGSLLAGLVDETLAGSGLSTGRLDVPVSDRAAAGAGLACGGRATLLLQSVASVPGAAWQRLRDRAPVAVLTDVETGSTSVVTDDRDQDRAAATPAAIEPAAFESARRLLRQGRSGLEVVDGVAVEAFVPPTTVRIVGHAAVGDALVRQAELLGWKSEVVDGVDDAVRAARAQASHDALVVLSHDATVDTPSLDAVLGHGRGYVGALGSRGTQAARRERLRRLGHDDDALDRIHGPVGLDLGSRTPAETAVAIVAEILAHRSGRSATSLRSTDVPING